VIQEGRSHTTAARRILYISGSIGLGHAARDLAIVNALRRVRPGLEVEWLAGPPARQMIEEAGETVLPESDSFDETGFAEAAAESFSLNLMSYVTRVTASWIKGVRTVLRLTKQHHFDLVVGDETYLLAFAYILRPRLKKVPFTMIYDFLGADAVTRKPWERLLTYLLNRTLCGGRKGEPFPFDLTLFIGEPEDVPDRPFGPGLPNRRDYALRNTQFVGYAFPFEPEAYRDRAQVRARLGYDQRRVVLCTVGGTAVGEGLLRLCAAAYPRIKEQVPDARMLLVAGPRIDTNALEAPPGVEILGYVPRLYEHLAACDVAIVQAGGTTTLELTALRRPFAYFPLERHFEQTLVADQLSRHGAGKQLTYSQTTPELLAGTVIRLLDCQPTWPAIPTDGAQRAAALIDQLLERVLDSQVTNGSRAWHAPIGSDENQRRDQVGVDARTPG
jgi:UDP:flavonoid glycosyltransferase YjiC (YdhE family)